MKDDNEGKCCCYCIIIFVVIPILFSVLPSLLEPIILPIIRETFKDTFYYPSLVEYEYNFENAFGFNLECLKISSIISSFSIFTSSLLFIISLSKKKISRSIISIIFILISIIFLSIFLLEQNVFSQYNIEILRENLVVDETTVFNIGYVIFILLSLIFSHIILTLQLLRYLEYYGKLIVISILAIAVLIFIIIIDPLIAIYYVIIILIPLTIYASISLIKKISSWKYSRIRAKEREEREIIEKIEREAEERARREAEERTRRVAEERARREAEERTKEERLKFIETENLNIIKQAQHNFTEGLWENAIDLFKKSKQICIEQGWADGVNYAENIILECENGKKREKEEKERREKLEKLMRRSTSIKIDMVRDILNLDTRTFNEKILEWADEFDFTINGDYLQFNKETVEDFIDILDKQFEEWHKEERHKIAKKI